MSSVFGPPTVTNGSQSFGGSTSVTVTINTALGDLIVVAVNNSYTMVGGTFGVTDTIGNTYTKLTSAGPTSFGYRQHMYWTISTGANASNVVTVDLNGNNGATNVTVWDTGISGGTAAFDTSAVGSDDSNTVVSTGTFNTAGSDEIVFSAAMDINNPKGTFSQGSGYTLDAAAVNTGAFNYLTQGAQHVVYTSPQTGIAATMTYSQGPNNIAIIAAAFKGSGSAGASTQPIVILFGL